MNLATIAEILWLLSGYAILVSPLPIAWAVLKWRSGARPPSREEWRHAAQEAGAWASADLEDDFATIRRYDAADVAVRGVETVAMLGLLLRFAIHYAAYRIATDDDPDEWTIGFGDPVGPRPMWHRLSATLTTGMLVAWWATMYPVGQIDVHGLERVALMSWLWINATAAVCDPLLIGWQPLTRTVTKRYT